MAFVFGVANTLYVHGVEILSALLEYDGLEDSARNKISGISVRNEFGEVFIFPDLFGKSPIEGHSSLSHRSHHPANNLSPPNMLCPDCTTGGLLNGEPTGIISTQGAYFAQAPNGSESAGDLNNSNSKRVVLLLTDAFGLPLKNSKVIADNLAIHLKCDVWVPDYFAGRPLMSADNLALPPPAGVKMGISDWIRFVTTLIKAIPGIIRNRSSVVDKRLAKFIHTIQEEKKYTKIGAVGYCFGGATAIRIGSADLIHSAVVCHPGPFSLDQAKAIKIPTAWVCAEEDMFFSNSLRLKVEAAFAQRKGGENFVDYEFKEYKGTTHGFATRPNLDIPEIKEAYQKAFEQIVEWFNKTLVI